MTHSDVLIIGGSLNGNTLALALAQAGIRSTIIDALPAQTQQSDRFDGRSYALALASVRMLGALGLWDQMAPNAQPMMQIKVSDGRPGEGPVLPFSLQFDQSELEEGPMGHMVEDRHLRPALLEAVLAEPLIELRDDLRVVSQNVENSGTKVALDNGDELSASLIVGADGKRGPTAERAGIRRKVTDYGQSALVCAIGHELSHQGVAHQFFMPSGPLAILPLRNNRSSIVWTEKTADAQAVQALDDGDYLDVLYPRFGDFLGDIHLAGDRFIYPLTLSMADAFTADRVALVGDAARAVHPLAGQGLNAGFRDVAALAETLADARRRGEDIGGATVLDSYALWRRSDSETLACATHGFNRLFSSDHPLLRLGRDLGMGAVNAIPALRRGLMREAAGLTGDVPRLLQGKPI
ncbi:FAD-dependent monooxygenase [Qingshengfaniella alkalisoli]|nr:FAD-dependent monooxygenase [Qingshengfaniella alkalisoli]